MYGKQAIIILVSFKVMCLHTSNLVNILVSEKNFFYKINSQLHSLTNKLFSSLNLDHEFTRNTKTKALLNMHSDLNKLAENYSSIYDEIQRIAIPEVTGNTTELENLFKSIICEETNKLKNVVENGTNTTSKNNDTFEFELERFVNNVLDKITSTRRINRFKIPTLRVKTREIKVWQPGKSRNDTNQTNINARRIFKGKKTRVQKYPFLVSIHLKNEFSCAGSIISKDLVITAATCLHIAYNSSGEYLRFFFVRVGSDYTNRLGELIPVIEIIFHPGYDPDTLKNNIAIIRIMKRVKFSGQRKIKRIQYDRDEDLIDRDKSVTILGWGAKSANSESSETHRVSVAHLDIYDFYECEEIYTRNYVTEKNFCAGFVSKGGGACNRDVGGPGIVSGRLVGIISFGPLVCGMTDAPTVFTKVGEYVKWIDDIIRQKPQLNAVVPNKHTRKPLRAFPMPILTTQNPIKPATVPPDTGTTEVVYPDEIVILKEILQEIIISNNSIIDYILYGDMLVKETDAINILSTTEKVDIYHHPLANHSIFTIGRQNMQNRIKTAKQATDKNNDDSSSDYEDTDTGIKILESLIGFHTFIEKSATPKRFYIANNNNLKSKQVINSIEYVIRSSINEREQDIPNDSSGYYEDEPGISIEASKEPIVQDLEKENSHFEKGTTRISNPIPKRIKLENYKNEIFGVIHKNQENSKSNTENTNTVRKTKTGKATRENRESNNKTKVKMDVRPKGVAILNEDFAYDEKTANKQDYLKNMRSKYKTREPIRWIGNRDWVGHGVNGMANYQDNPHFPFPAVRFKENTRDICALREKERGDWKMLCCEEKKALYRASFCQTFAEFQHPTGQWKMVLGFVFICTSYAMWFMIYNHYYVYEPLPASFSKESQKAQLRRMLEIRVNPIDGLSSKWDYDNDRWK